MAERPDAMTPDVASYAAMLEDSAEDLYENAPCGYLSTLLDGTIAKVNQTLLDWTGYSREQLVGRRRFQDLLSTGGRIYYETHVSPLLRMQGATREIALEVVRAAGDRLSVLVNSAVKYDKAGTPLLLRTTVFDATDRKRYERELLRAQNEARQEARRSSFLLEAATVLAAATSLRETLDRLAVVAVPILGDICFIDVLDEQGNLVRRAGRHADPECQPLVDEIGLRYPPAVDASHPSAVAVRERRAVWSAEMSEDFLRDTTRDARHLELVRTLGCIGYITVPLIVRSRVLGTVTVISTDPTRRFDDDDFALVDDLARQVALVVAKAQRYEEERHVSHTLQAGLLPRRLPELAMLDVAVRYLPGTRDVEVGGDFYDVVALGSDVVAVVGDVAGHDITAAVTMGQLRSAVRALVGQVAGPGELVERLQETWDVLDLDRMATAVFAWLDPVTGALRCSNAGHFPPLVVDAGRASFVPVDPSPPLGITSVAGAAGLEWSGELPPGATLLLYTDGLIERRERDLDAGLARLAEAALAVDEPGPEALCSGVLDRLLDGERGDDVALLAVTRKPA